MAKMPGVMVEGPWSPEDDAEAARKARAYKPEMAEVKPPPGPVFSGPDDSAPATFIEPSRPSLWERTKEHFNYQVNHGFFALGDLMEMRLQRLNAEEKQAELAKMQAEGQGDTMAAKRTEMEMFQSAGESEMARTARAEDTFRFENMPAAEGVLENAAAVVGGFAGSIDPTVIVPEAKIGTTAWRMGSPVISKMLDYGVSNAAMNALLNASVQAGELGADIRDEIDWDSVLLDAGVGAAMGVPFGYIHGRAARDEMAQLVQAPEPGMAPWAPPRTGPRVENVPKPERVPDQTTVESISEAHAPEEITAAQETLFGEVVGTRNLTPEQLNQVDDYINAGKPYGEEFPRETTVQDMPPVREPAQSEAEPLPQVSERGQPQGSANPAPADQGASPRAQEPAPLGADYQDLKPEDLKVDASRFQFKGGGDSEGVIDTLKKVKTWDRKKAGVIMVWEDLAGNKFVVDGHQRYGLAKRLKAEGQDQTLHAMVWREADGITAEDAKVLAADINISQGSGTAVDAAKILRARPEMLDNLPKNAVTDHGVGLAKLSDDAFGMVVNGKVPPEYGAIVGKLAPNTSTHAQIMDVLAKNEPASAAQAESMVRDVLAAPEVEQTMTDMFGSSEVTQILFKERAQVLSSAATALRKDRAAFNTLVKEEARLTGAGNKLATATNLERAQTDAEILATLQATARRKGPVADALAAAAKSLHDGTPRQVAVREFLDRIRGEVKGASPDGKGISPSSQSIAASLGGYRNTDTPAFGRWFGDSKVVDENGDPLVVHHGTGEKFDAFSKDMVGTSFNQDARGFFFTDSRPEAEGYARNTSYGLPRDTPGTVQDVYLSIRNPLVKEIDFDPIDAWDNNHKAFQEEAARGGHDGITIKARKGASMYVAFEPTQIKSIYNRGTWDAEDPRISFSAPRQAGPGLFDVGADKKPQAVLPGAERIGDKSLAERRAAAPLKPTKPQKSLDFGLFGDSGDQMDLVDLARLPKMVKQDADYLDFSPSGTAKNAIIGKASITYAAKDGEVEILAFRVPTQFRRRGEGREALLAFLEKADDEGLAVRAYSTPLDRSTDREGIIRFYEGLGFTATGRKINAAGDIEMLRSGPPPEVAELRQLVGQGRLIPLRDYTEPAMAQQVSQAFYNTQPSRPLDALYEGGILQKHQDRLGRVGDEIAQITGAKFKNPGLKKKATAQQKMIRKRYKGTNRLADLVRAGFLVDTPDQAQRVVNLLAENFRVLDEGWAVLAEGYFDRKVMVQFADGTIGEVQIWEPSLLKAKMEGGGHELYTAARDLPPGPEKAALQKKMEDLYYPLLDALDPSWGATVGREGKMPNVRENSSRMASSEASNLPESPTSAESTSSQSAPGSSTAQAKPLSETAGRPSQSTNFMESSILGEDTGAGRASQGSKPSQEWRTVEIVAQTETGETVKLPAGEAVDYMLSRIKAARELLDCVNAG